MKTHFLYVPLFFIFSFSLFIPAQAQWVPLTLPGDHTVNKFAVKDGSVFAATGSGIFKSSNNGSTWLPVNNGLPGDIHTLFVSGNSIYAGSYPPDNSGGAFVSTNDGASWTNISNGLTIPNVYDIAAVGNALVAVVEGGDIYHSTDNGASWNLTDSGIRSYVDSASIKLYFRPQGNCLAVMGNLFLAGTKFGMFVSTNNGTSWYAPDTMPGGSYFDYLLVRNDTIFATTESSGIFMSTDTGASWTLMEAFGGVHSVLMDENRFFVGTGSGIFLSTDNGAHLNQYGLSSEEVISLAVNGNYIFAGTTNGVFCSTDNGNTWLAKNAGLTNIAITALLQSNSDLFAGSYNGLLHSSDDGDSWSFLYQGLPSNDCDISSLVKNDNFIFAGLNPPSYDNQYGVYLSTNNGISWQVADSGLNSLHINTLFVHKNLVFAGTGDGSGWNGGIYCSSDNGISWHDLYKKLDSTAVLRFADNGNTIFAGTIFSGSLSNGLYRSLDDGLIWSPSDSGLSGFEIFSLATEGDTVYAGAVNNDADTGSIFISYNNGDAWFPLKGVFPANLSCSVLYGTALFIGTNGGGVTLSTNNGIDWQNVSDGLTDGNIYSLALDKNYLFAGTDLGIYRRPLSDFGINAVEEKTAYLPTQLALSQNYPNPFSGMTNVEYKIPNEEPVTLTVYNSLGEEIATLASGVQSAGEHNVTFNGNELQNGIYFYRLTAGNNVQSGKMMVIK